MGKQADHGTQIKNDKQYEALRKKGYSKKKAAQIANSDDASEIGGRSRKYEDWTKQELYAQAKKVDIKGRSKMSKGELMQVLRSN